MNPRTGGITTPSTLPIARGVGSAVPPTPTMPPPKMLGNKSLQSQALRDAMQKNMNSSLDKAGKGAGIGYIPSKFR